MYEAPIVFAGSFIVSLTLLFVIVRILPADFLTAVVNERSNHSQPARQIGGLAVGPAAILAILGCAIGLHGSADPVLLLAAAAGACLLLVVGFLDDRHELSVGWRLAGQFSAAMVFVWALGVEDRILPDGFPVIVELGLAVVVLVWFVNMTNFMDGLDLMVVAGIGIPHLILASLGVLAIVEGDAAIVSAAVAGALLGFLPFNYPPAKTFLGDGGSLCIGFLTGVVVLLMARRHPVAALLPFLYFLVDSVSVLIIRLARRENVFRAHSSHAYQLARRSGRSVLAVIARVAGLGVVCGALTMMALARDDWRADVAALAVGMIVVGGVTMRMRAMAKRAR